MSKSNKDKDFCVYFYVNDWLGGTLLFNRIQRGCYIDLLVAQCNNVSMSIDDIKSILGEDFHNWDLKVKEKFLSEEVGGITKYYNERMRKEILRRQKYSNSRSENRSGTKEEKAAAPHQTEVRRAREKDFKDVTNWDNCDMYEYSELSDELKKMYAEDIWIKWLAFNKYIDEHCVNIRKIDVQIKIFEYVKLKAEFIDSKKVTVEDFFNKMDAFDNHKGIETKYSSVYKAFVGWLRNDFKNDKK